MLTVNKSKKEIADQYGSADEKTKKVLDLIFGSKFFLPVHDRIKTWEDAAAEKGLDPVNSLPFIKPMDTRQEAANAFFMLDVIAEIICEGETLDWSNSDQRKWFPVFNDYTSGSGFRFDDSSYIWSVSSAKGGARLCVPTKEKADYFGKQFIDLWNKFLNPNK